MATICPTVTAYDQHEYREQLERIMSFAGRIHLDFMDGELAPTKSPPLEHAWVPDDRRIDIHLMYKRPADFLDDVILLKPQLLIVHAEADGNFVTLAKELHNHGIKAGIALMPATDTQIITPALDHIDHVLIFSGDIGHFGGHADLTLLTKIHEIRSLKPDIEIGWDGGINDQNAGSLIDSGADVLNVGGYIQKAENAEAAYDILKQIAEI